MYARFWTKFLHDLGYVPFDEPFQKMINQGMIQGNSALVYRVIPDTTNRRQEDYIIYVSANFSSELKEIDKKFKVNELTPRAKEIYEFIRNKEEEGVVDYFTKFGEEEFQLNYSSSLINVDINYLDGDKLDLDKFRNWRAEFENAEFIKEENGDFIVGREIDKMSKSKYNVQTPDELVEKFGADTLRCYEMFLGPLEQHKPWDTQGITGVHGFLKKLWRLYHDDNGFNVSDEIPSNEELKLSLIHI